IEKAINKRKKEITQTPKLDVSLITKEKLKKRLTVLKKAGIIVAGIAVAILIMVGSYHAFILYQEKQERERQARYIEYLSKKYAIHISDRDIFFYANDVAVKNGYSRIDIKSLKEKNPHWIYPGNRFILLDGEVVIVKPGDTLWGISERKLLSLNITFYTLLDELEKKIDKGIIDEHLAQKAMNAAIHTKHRERVKALLQKMNELKAKQNNT
ncbi:MAG TPA: LysM peptidoglycan-binding domain-containing protein, partial [Spirochaetota bacterium]|nr:LysM peptidoglycan-binding domain-containing protein [Spirochaetota bacterium]